MFLTGARESTLTREEFKLILSTWTLQQKVNDLKVWYQVRPGRCMFTASYWAVKCRFIVPCTDCESSPGLQKVSGWLHNSSSSVFGSGCESLQLCSLTTQTWKKAVEDRDHSGNMNSFVFSSLSELLIEDPACAQWTVSRAPLKWLLSHP